MSRPDEVPDLVADLRESLGLPRYRSDDVARLREALEDIATRPLVERNPDGADQAAWSMRLIARETFDALIDGGGA